MLGPFKQAQRFVEDLDKNEAIGYDNCCKESWRVASRHRCCPVQIEELQIMF